MTFWNNFTKNNLIIAHRGANAIRPENTMSAFKEAIGKSDFIELDVGFSKDGVAIVIHDDTLERTTDVKKYKEFKSPYKIIDYTYKQLIKLDLGYNQKIPTLQEVLEFLYIHNMPINVEIKDLINTPFDKIAVERIIKIIQLSNMQNLVILSSFNHTYLKEAYKIDPIISRAALEKKNCSENLVSYLQNIPVDTYHPHIDIVTKDMVQELHDNNIFVNVFTVNNTKEKQRLFDIGVKAIFTDYL